ncbi:zinc finger CCCH domain-containing protein 18 [Daktulosphaira vitifoliae]|uniref:zinc finger CCCH domain-containing protein 18 n=1 Tax=Daktulosphaira vitifoliae TaxID=58002 RepID=UPI0021A9F07C|nr:zinc finger CCCH domain-containing protein 18 [Daktulosphaira vitifoliae]XP_050544753.1 zinc finger CCCH domain-containing protein 18 [Daktulosphaira vitifoliae]
MESENSSNSDDSQSNSSRSASPETEIREQSISRSPTPSSHNSTPQSPIADGACSPKQQNQSNSPSSVSSSSSHASSVAESATDEASQASSKSSSRSRESDKDKKPPVNYAEDLSDVSDEDSMDNINSEENITPKSNKEWNFNRNKNFKDDAIPVNGHDSMDAKIEPITVNDSEEPLDFEAEEGEDGECDGLKPAKEDVKAEEEKLPEELEEGEVSDEGEHRPEETEPRPICRFYSRGQCTWGASCRFLHPGVTDKGNYSMFEMVRPIPPPGGLPFFPPDPYRPHERPLIPGIPLVPVKKEDVPPVESAWERGLRQAKEILKKSNKKKETDIDFEEKKMNLTSNQEEVEKENDYYAQRPSSPAVAPAISPPLERFKSDLEARHHRGPLPDAYVEDFIPPHVDFYHHRPEYWPPHHGRPLPHFPGHPMDFHAAPRRNPYYPYPPPDPYYHPGLKPHHRGLPPKYPPNREVIVQRTEKSYSPQPSGHRNRRDRSSSRPHRGDDWADPWMRSKSPGGRSKLRGRKKSYSSHSSFSSSRSSSSSSASSYSSRSRSRARSNSMSKLKKKQPAPFKTSPGRKSLRKPERNLSPEAFDKKLISRSMNPPMPTNRWSVSPTHSGPIMPPIQRGRQMPMPPRFANKGGAKSPSSTHTSSSSSSSNESGSGSGSSESSESSDSESSSEGSGTHRQIRKRDQEAKKELLKAQKSQIKLNLKKKMAAPAIPPVKKEKSIIQGKKRAIEADHDDAFKNLSPPRKKGAVPSRREELLKQLKAVEDAIARKKSKVVM